ncbi:MAG: hypothetical protein M0T79_08405 [Actinomycetota bacterium]|jgi:hypothetical protein|nr:hypothetical protein [Actinomycetota bacterium]
MPEWCSTRPVDVARLNSSVFLAVLCKYGVFSAIAAPIYFATVVILGERRAPKLGAGHILAATWPYFLTGFVGRFLLGLLAGTFIAAVGSLVWWRHILAVGGPYAALAALASAARRLVARIERRVDPSLVATLARRPHITDVVPIQSLLDQLRAALLGAPAAPPLRLAVLADRSVRTDQLIPRRTA